MQTQAAPRKWNSFSSFRLCGYWLFGIDFYGTYFRWKEHSKWLLLATFIKKRCKRSSWGREKLLRLVLCVLLHYAQLVLFDLAGKNSRQIRCLHCCVLLSVLVCVLVCVCCCLCVVLACVEHFALLLCFAIALNLCFIASFPLSIRTHQKGRPSLLLPRPSDFVCHCALCLMLCKLLPWLLFAIRFRARNELLCAFLGPGRTSTWVSIYSAIHLPLFLPPFFMLCCRCCCCT